MRDFSGLVRLCIVLIVGVATLFGVVGFASALHTLDYRADQNAELSHLKRLYGYRKGFPIVIRDESVVEDALEALPEKATYRVLIGSGWKPSVRSRWTRSIEEDFLRYYLFPRRQVYSDTTPWAFCLGCNLARLGRVQVISHGSDGMSFVRVLR